jgi:hypothetical protein
MATRQTTMQHDPPIMTRRIIKNQAGNMDFLAGAGMRMTFWQSGQLTVSPASLSGE